MNSNELPAKVGGLQAIETALVRKMQREQREGYKNIYQRISETNVISPVDENTGQDAPFEVEHRVEVNAGSLPPADIIKWINTEQATEGSRSSIKVTTPGKVGNGEVIELETLKEARITPLTNEEVTIKATPLRNNESAKNGKVSQGKKAEWVEQ